MTNPSTLQLTGIRFSRLLVKIRIKNIKNCTAWLCICDCGNEKIVLGIELRSGHVRSCGCLRSDNCLDSVVTHGMSHTRTYDIWIHVKSRCLNLKNKDYSRYGGRGISFSSEWESFDIFFRDMGVCPDGMTIDRKDNDAGYSKDNCRWASRKVQRRNNSANVMVSIKGNVMALADACDLLGLKLSTVYMRIRRGSSHEQALGI